MRYNHNLRLHIRSGALYSIYDGFTTLFLVAYLLVLGASPFEIGLVSAMPSLAMLLSQLPGLKLLDYFSRLQVYGVSTISSRFLWIPILAVGVSAIPHKILLITILYFILRFSETACDASWASLTTDIVPKKRLGEFFGRRLWLMAITGTVAYLIGGFVLGQFPKTDLTGFSILFSVGVVFGLLCSCALLQVKEPPYHHDGSYSLFSFIHISPQYKLFCIFSSVFYFAYNIAAPFYTVYLLKDLNLGYELYVAALSISTLVKIAAQQEIGRLVDRLGEKFMGLLGVLFLAFVPFIYYFITPSTLWLLFPAQILSGLTLAAMNVVLSNLQLDLGPDGDRALNMAQYDMSVALPLAAAPLLGGWIVEHVSVAGLGGIPLIFLLSTGALFISLLFFIPIPEPRVKTPRNPMYILLHRFRSRSHLRHGGNHGL